MREISWLNMEACIDMGAAVSATLQCALTEAHLRGLLAQLRVARVVKLQAQQEIRCRATLMSLAMKSMQRRRPTPARIAVKCTASRHGVRHL